MRFRFECCFFACFLLLVACDANATAYQLEHRGATIAHVHQRGEGYGSGVTATLYPHLQRVGYDSIQLNTFAYQTTARSTTLFWNDPTLREGDLRSELQAARAAGFSVMLKPHIWVGAQTEWRRDIAFRDPRNRAKWFASYRDFLAPQVDIAITEQVEFFTIGTELVGLSSNAEEWRAVIGFIRGRGYQGELGYACEAWNANNISFWDDLDFVGVDFYYPVPGDNPEATAAYREWSERLREHRSHADDWGKPLYFTELGFPSNEMAIRKPHTWPAEAERSDFELQATAYEAVFEAMHDVGPPDGLWIWKYATTLNSYEANYYRRGFFVRDKPAEDQIQKYFLSSIHAGQ